MNNGGPAFPGIYGDGSFTPKTGMSLRDYFAGQAMVKWYIPKDEEIRMNYDRLAEHCYKVADAMLLARVKETK